MNRMEQFASSQRRLFVAASMVGVLLLASILSTQYAAFQLGYCHELGDPWWVIPYPFNRIFFIFSVLVIFIVTWRIRKKSGYPWAMIGMAFVGILFVLPFYNPFHYWDWYRQYGENKTIQSIWIVGWVIWGLAILICTFLAASLHRGIRQRNQPDTYGSAHWATIEEIEATGLKDCEDMTAVYVGAWQHPKTKKIYYLRSSGQEHIFAYAPTRSGKGVGLVLPTLLSYWGTVIVADFKLENWYYTAGWRQQQGSWVLKLDFTCQDGSGARFNPLFEVRRGINEVRDVQSITDLLVNPDGRTKSDHWTEAANSLLVSIILHVLYAERDKSLTGVRDFLANPHRNEVETLKYMLSTEHDPNSEFNWTDNSTGRPTKIHPLVASGAREMLNKSEGERTSIVSTTLTYLKLYRDPIIAQNTRDSDFTIADLLSNEKPISLYLGVPPSDIVRVMPLMRLVLNQILNRLTETLDLTTGPSSTKQKESLLRYKILLLLDEFPQFGRLAFFEKALAYIAGFGIRAYLISQDLTQLYAEYGKNQSIIANCGIRIAYAPNTLETAEHLSELLGSTTIVKQQKNYSGYRFDMFLKHMVTSENEVKRSLLIPDELMRMPAHKAIIFKTGHAPIDGHKIYYYQDHVLNKRSQISTSLNSDRLSVENSWKAIIMSSKDAAFPNSSFYLPAMSLGTELLPDTVDKDIMNGSDLI